MPEFSRGFSEEKLRLLIAEVKRGRGIAAAMSLWRASGDDGNNSGIGGLMPLRLAFRNDTINLYYFGQPIARIGVSDTVPWLSVHYKYACPKKYDGTGEEPPKNPYIRMSAGQVSGDTLLDPNGNPTSDFRKTILGWMREVREEIPESAAPTGKKGYAGYEKTLIEKILSNSKNNKVIDLEVGIPGLNKRIDLATIEDLGGHPCIFFGEVKYFQDGRMRKAVKDGVRPDPEVISGQLAPYGDWLKDNKDAVGKAYIRAACQMLQLWNATGNKGDLPQAIRQAAKCKTLAVCATPRLIVISSAVQRKGRAYPSWGEHKAILQNRFAEYPLFEIDADWDQLSLATPV
jgi:hypothetical protein